MSNYSSALKVKQNYRREELIRNACIPKKNSVQEGVQHEAKSYMSTSTEQSPGFSTLRKVFWPIHGYETKKFLPLAVIMFFVIFNYTVLRNTKDSLIVTALGAETIPFLKGVIVLPFSVLFVTFYAKLSNVLSHENLFYTTIGCFLGFFVFYLAYLYPNQSWLHASPETIEQWRMEYPNFQHFLPLLGSWSNTLFYLFAELWGPVVINLLFWQFANEITRVHEARRFYAMFGLLGHFALIAAGKFGNILCDLPKEQQVVDSYATYLYYVIVMVTLSGLIVIAIYAWMHRYVLSNPFYYDQAETISSHKEDKPKLSLWDSITYIVTSRYIGFIVLMVLSYGLCMNLTGILWKKQLQFQYPDALSYANFMSNFSYWTGVTTITLIFFLKNVVERFGWYKGAIFTPIVLLVTVIPFFAFMFFRGETEFLVAWMGLTPLMTAIIIGAVQQIFSKSAKYSMFDPTKEMTYIPLDQELKVKGKAAVDVTSYSFAKACGGYLSGGLLIFFAASDLMVIAPYLAVTVLIMIVFWLHAVRQLSKMYYRLINRGF